MAYDRKDHYYRRAKAEGKASRAAYKLTQLNDKFHLIRRGSKVVDLGAAPGGWLAEAAKLVGSEGRVVGIDLLPLKITLPVNARFLQGRLGFPSPSPLPGGERVRERGDTSYDELIAQIKEILGGEADVVLSDMAPNTSGVAFADAYRSYELGCLALETCEHLLKSSGQFVVKIFPGDELKEYERKLRERFSKVTLVRPPATRTTSSEIYFVSSGYKKPTEQ